MTPDSELHYVRTIENCTFPRPRNMVLVFPDNAINCADVEVTGAGACVNRQTGNSNAARYIAYQFQFRITILLAINAYVVRSGSVRRAMDSTRRDFPREKDDLIRSLCLLELIIKIVSQSRTELYISVTLIDYQRYYVLAKDRNNIISARAASICHIYALRCAASECVRISRGKSSGGIRGREKYPAKMFERKKPWRDTHAVVVSHISICAFNLYVSPRRKHDLHLARTPPAILFVTNLRASNYNPGPLI